MENLEMTKKILRRNLTILALISWGLGGVGQLNAAGDDKKIKSDSSLKMDLGYFAESTKVSLTEQKPLLEKAFADNGLSVSVSLTKAGVSTPKMPVKWDLAMTNFVLVSMQRKNQIPVTPIFWAKDCSFEASAFTLGGSMVISSYEKKKVLIYGFGYPTASVLRAIDDWKLSNATLYLTDDPMAALDAMLNKKVDLLISDTTVRESDGLRTAIVFGPRFDKERYQIVSKTNYKYPCRVLSVANKVSPKDVELIKKVVAMAPNIVLKRFDLINPEERKKLESTFQWKALEKIESKILPYPKQ